MTRNRVIAVAAALIIALLALSLVMSVIGMNLDVPQ